MTLVTSERTRLQRLLEYHAQKCPNQTDIISFSHPRTKTKAEMVSFLSESLLFSFPWSRFLKRQCRLCPLHQFLTNFASSNAYFVFVIIFVTPTVFRNITMSSRSSPSNPHVHLAVLISCYQNYIPAIPITLL